MCPRLALTPTLSQGERERKDVSSSFDLSASSEFSLLSLSKRAGGSSRI